MSGSQPGEVTQLLRCFKAGNRAAVDQLLDAVYPELRDLAGRFFEREPRGSTLQPTALVHEAYMKLVDQTQIDWQGRTHFYAVAAQAMRRILVDRARQRGAIKRGGARKRVWLDEDDVPCLETDDDVIAVDEALLKLAKLDACQARMVELRFFGGLTVSEAAEELGMPKRTAERDWQMTRAWFRRELGESA